MFRFGSEGAKRKAGGKLRESTKTKAVQEKRNETLVGYAREARDGREVCSARDGGAEVVEVEWRWRFVVECSSLSVSLDG